MKILKVLFGASSITAGLLLQAQAQTISTNGLIAYYAFNGDVNDSSGNGNNGTDHGATFANNRFGFAGAAIYFNHGSVSTSFFPPLGTASRTFSGWFNVPRSPVQVTLMAYGAPSTYSGDRFELKIFPSGQFALDGSYGTLWTPADYADSNWHSFVVVVPDNAALSNVVFYMDGILQTDLISDAPANLINTAGLYPLQFGELFINWDSRQLTGSLDEVRIYNRALPAAEVRQLSVFARPGLTNSGQANAGRYRATAYKSYESATSATAKQPISPAGVSLGTYPGLAITGAVGNTFGIQYSTNLNQTEDWTTITNITLSQPVQMWFDAGDNINDGTQPRKFYRVVALP